MQMSPVISAVTKHKFTKFLHDVAPSSLLLFSVVEMDLSSFINKAHCECLNESDEHGLAGALTSQDGFLESDCDEQVNRHLCVEYLSANTMDQQM